MIKPCIFCLAKYEYQYIEEFIVYHLFMGFDKIYVYDNEDTPTYKSLLSKYFDKVEVIHFPGNNNDIGIQGLIMMHFVQNYMYKTDITHVIHIDIDEFIVLKKHKNIKEFINEYIVGDCAAITINWRFFGSSGLNSNDGRPVTERFIMREKKYSTHIKTLFDKTKFDRFRCCHNIVSTEGYHVKDTNGLIITHTAQNVNMEKDNIIQLNHYASKTLPEYVYQRKRGACDIPLKAQKICNDAELKRDFGYKNINEVQDLRACAYYKEATKEKIKE
jgi:hypothetical protein